MTDQFNEEEMDAYDILCAANRYQEFTKTTALYPPHKGVNYCALGLVSEAGEVAGKIKKSIRDGHAIDVQGISAELGDVCWYVARLADEIGVDFGRILLDNMNKLKGRKERGTIGGSGDVR